MESLLLILITPLMSTNKKLFILDVSGFLFRAYYALPPMTAPNGNATHALYGFIRSFQKLCKDFTPEHIVAVFDGPDNKKQRKEIYEKYKMNRKAADADLPAQMELVKDFCALVGVTTVELPGVEADDAMGSIAYSAAKEGFEIYLCTSDKDLCQLVGGKIFVLNPWKENLIIDSAKVEEIYGVPPKKIIDLLAMMGDSSDNIPGLTGFGPKTATQLLKEFGSLDAILANPLHVKGAKKQETLINEADIAILSRRLATIHTDIPFPHSKEWFAPQMPDLANLRAFYLDLGLNSLVRELEEEFRKEEGHEEKEIVYTIVDDEESLIQLIKDLQKHKEICVDIETTTLQSMLAMPVGIGLGVKEGEAFYIPLNGQLGSLAALKFLKPFFEESGCSFYGHNVKFDCHALQNIGIAKILLSFDTILASSLLNSASRRHSLEHLTLYYFGKVMTPIKDLIGTGKKEISMLEVPIPKVGDYCCEDVDYTTRIKKLLEKQIEKRGFGPLLYDLELPLSSVLLRMERNGMYVDIPHLQKLSEEFGNEIKTVEEEIYSMAGEEFNLNSPKQLSQILFDKLQIKSIKKTATGLSTNAAVLEMLALEYPIAEKILAYRTLDKLRSTYIDALPQNVNPETSRIHPTFNQFVTATGRLSCQDPNLQNIPIRTEAGRKIRAAFRPEKKGWSYLAADYSQIELRLLAYFSQDPTLMKAFQAGEDIHTFTAALVFGIPLEKVSNAQRHQAKAINFGIVYGQQAYGLSQELKIEVSTAAAFIEAYFERYPKVFEFMQKSIAKVKECGFSTTMIGRERAIPEITSNNSHIRAAAERLAINAPLQGSAADLIKLAMLKINETLTKEGLHAKMILQVHDELLFEAPDEEIDTLQKIAKNGMEKCFELGEVPLLVDIAIGKNWGKC